MKSTILAALAAVSLALCTLPQMSRADDAPASTCKDGTTSTSTGKGTCSGHGGVQKATKSTAAAPAAKPAAAAPAAAAPAAAKTSTCKDGSTSTSTGKGTCSSHGGVQKAAPATAPAPAN